jgi:hypothetical protein
MANSDKNILITPSVGLSTNPTIKFNGANNTPTTLRVLDNGTVSFEGTSGQLFSIADSLSGSIFSVNDISGIPSIEVVDTGLVKINQYGGSTVFGASAAIQNSSSVNAKVSIQSPSATTPGLIVRGFASSSANIQEWQRSDGFVLLNVSYAGDVSAGSGSSTAIRFRYFDGIAASGTYWDTTATNSATFNGRSTTAATMVIKAAASQTANLQEWQNSAGTVFARFDSYGYFNAYGYTLPTSNGSFESAYGGAFMAMKKTTSAVANPVADVARMYLVAGTTAGTLKLVIKAGTAGAETTILDNIPQS